MTAESERLGTFSDAVALHDMCVDRIDAGDLDFDDWVYRSRNTCADFMDAMYEIGWGYKSPRRPRAHMGWLYRLVTKAAK